MVVTDIQPDFIDIDVYPPEIIEVYNACIDELDGGVFTYFQLRSKGKGVFGGWLNICAATKEELRTSADWHIKRAKVVASRFEQTLQKKSVKVAGEHLIRAQVLREKLADLEREAVA